MTLCPSCTLRVFVEYLCVASNQADCEETEAAKLLCFALLMHFDVVTKTSIVSIETLDIRPAVLQYKSVQ
jgi:hypothetical protein